MQTVEQAVEAFGEAIGLDTIAFDGMGNLTLVFNDTMPLNFARQSDTVVELWTTLPDISSDAQALRRLLEANHLGEGTGAARLALQPNGGAAILCERIDVRAQDGETLMERVLGFVRYADFWRSRQAGGSSGSSLPADDASRGMIFRV